jgi:predicted ATPase
MSLARLWQQQGKKDEAHQMLVEIYGWFTEGFDTKDLQEAKALLGEAVVISKVVKRSVEGAVPSLF